MKIFYFNVIQCKIDNLMWGVLKNKYIKWKKLSSYTKLDEILCMS